MLKSRGLCAELWSRSSILGHPRVGGDVETRPLLASMSHCWGKRRHTVSANGPGGLEVRLILATATVLMSGHSEAGTLRCSFTEPFFTITWDSESGRVIELSADVTD